MVTRPRAVLLNLRPASRVTETYGTGNLMLREKFYIERLTDGPLVNTFV